MGPQVAAPALGAISSLSSTFVAAQPARGPVAPSAQYQGLSVRAEAPEQAPVQTQAVAVAALGAAALGVGAATRRTGKKGSQLAGGARPVFAQQPRGSVGRGPLVCRAAFFERFTAQTMKAIMMAQAEAREFRSREPSCLCGWDRSCLAQR